MKTETMTVHEALCEIKVADNKILSAIDNLVAVAYKKHSAVNVNGISQSQFESEAKSGYQKVSDLIRRTEAIKKAISKSNAVTEIVVAGKSMSVAEAIYMMQHGLDAKRDLVLSLTTQYQKATAKIKKENEVELEAKLANYIKDAFGSKEKADAKSLEEARRVFEENNTYELIDPIDVKSVIDKLQDEIDSFASSVDSAIQMSNAKTTIEINY